MHDAPLMALHALLAAADASHQMLVTSVAAISCGTLLVVLARRLNFPAIVMLLAAGVLMGPKVLGIVHPSSLGDGLLVVVELAVGLILFEGGLTLQRDGYRSAPAMIKRLLTAGVLITWFG
ncbi:MAG: cation:proton antiporter domain-containing protein, partial [Planctomycetota bacterium]